MQIKSLTRPSGAWLLVVALAAIATVGCREDREVMQPVIGDSIFTFSVDAGLSAGLPGGAHAITDLSADVDPTASDAFGRATDDFGFELSSDGVNYTIDAAGLNSTQDPRLPALGGLGTEEVDTNNQCQFGSGPYWGGSDGWDLFCFLQGLRGNTDYTVMLVRYASVVNGEPDASEVLLASPVEQPDELVLLGGSPGGYPTELCDFDPARPTFTTGVTGSQNPLVLGFGTSNAGGALTFDCLVGSGGFWSNTTLTVPDSAPFAPNTATSFDLPRYNYVVVVEGVGTPTDPVPTGDHVLRFQVGVDLDQSGNPIANLYGPFPAERLTPAEIAAAPGLINVRAREAMVMLSPLAELSGGSYQLWLYNEETSAILAATAVREAFEETEGGPSLVATDTVTTFNSDPSFSYTLTVNDGTLGADTVGYFTHLLVSIQPSGATSLSEAIPIFSQYVDQAGTPADFNDDNIITDAALSFGSFDPGGDPYVYAVAGVGRAGFYGDEVRVNYVNVPLPPAGYFYEGWLMEGSGAAVNLGPLTGPYPEYVDLSDVATTTTPPDFVVEGVILQSTNRALASQQQPPLIDEHDNPTWYGYATYHLTLSLLLGTAAMPPSTALGGVVPDRIVARKP